MVNIHASKGKISSAFLELEIDTFEGACGYVKALPYKRPKEIRDILSVLNEGCGTCSSKHALIQALARENDIIECKLILCIFKMNSVNTPKVASVLHQFNLNFIPEAHTYILYQNEVLDLTFPDDKDHLFLNFILHEEVITPEQVQEYKVGRHKSFLADWLQENEIGYDLQELWRIRELCIEELAAH